MTSEDSVVVRDCNGTRLHDGDTVHVIKDLKVKGAGATLKQGTKSKGIRLTDNPRRSSAAPTPSRGWC